MTDLYAYKGAELEQALARVLAHARGELLHDAYPLLQSHYTQNSCCGHSESEMAVPK